ncbi:MAG TPA: DNA-processing protein DprA [Acidimicrobiia bacterium]|nr:DNA-processing protein DprA [Acidimicrobiia bacterium]
MTSPSPDTVRAALLLTNRLVTLAAEPLTAREFWHLVERVDVAQLVHSTPAEISELAGVDGDEAARLRTLLDATTAFAFEQDRLADGGVELVSALDDRFPTVLCVRLGAACPPFLFLAGPIEWLGRQALGVIGSRDADEAALDVARRSAQLAAEHGWQVVSGLARGVDQAAMAAALDAGGAVVGVPAEGIGRVARAAAVRSRVHAGELCLASPYVPDAPFRATNAMGRNKIIYALSSVAFAAAAEEGRGGTWSGAKEALDRRYAPVAVWTGPGATDGNRALARRGAIGVSDPAELFELDLTVEPTPPRSPPPQPSLF